LVLDTTIQIAANPSGESWGLFVCLVQVVVVHHGGKTQGLGPKDEVQNISQQDELVYIF